MATRYYKHSYATQRLMENGFKIYKNGKQILKYPFKEPNFWKFPKVETRIQVGIPFLIGDSYRTQAIRNYEDLMRYGLMVSKRSPRIQRFFAQKVEYFLTKLSPFQVDVGDFPLGHYVEINPRTREFKLIGKGSSGEWFNPFPRRAGEYQERISPFDQTGKAGYFDSIRQYLPIDEEKEYSSIIPEIVLGITEDGKIICIQEEKENPTIGIVGKKRFGKSILKHRIIDNTYHKWNKKCIELNDVMLETDSYSQRWIPKPITKFADLRLLNEPSIPLPMVYLHPKTTTLRNLVAKGETGFETYMSFEEFIKDYNNVLKGKEDWTFAKAGVYFRNLLYNSNGKLDRDGLAFCKNYSQMEAVVYKKLLADKTEEQKKTPSGVIPKILNVLKDIDNSKILDVSNKTDAKWTVEFPNGQKEKYYPWSACIIADLVPSIVTHDLKNHHPEYHPQYSNFILKDLFTNQNDNEYFVKNKIELFIYFDEILSLVNSPVARETFETVVRESGHSRIGFTYCSQYWDKIPEFIRSQTDYVISFNQKRNQADEIVKDFDAMKHRVRDLINLKKGEFIIFSSNPLVLYDEYGKKEIIEDEAIKATIFPSLSAHKAPKEIGV